MQMNEVNFKKCRFPKNRGGLKTAGAKRRRKEARADPDSVGRERGLISLGRVGVELWRATIIVPLFPPTSCQSGRRSCPP